jgi:hypothetical protein
MRLKQDTIPCTMLKHARYIVICPVLDELWIIKYIVCFYDFSIEC